MWYQKKLYAHIYYTVFIVVHNIVPRVITENFTHTFSIYYVHIGTETSCITENVCINPYII